MTSLLILSSLVYPVTLLRKRISAASRRVMSLYVATHIKTFLLRKATGVGLQFVYGMVNCKNDTGFCVCNNGQLVLFRTVILCSITQRVVIICYRRFGITNRSMNI